MNSWSYGTTGVGQEKRGKWNEVNEVNSGVK